MPYFFAILDKTHRKALFALHCIVALTAVDSNLDQKSTLKHGGNGCIWFYPPATPLPLEVFDQLTPC